MKFSLKFWIGIVLLLTNSAFGWGAIVIFNSMAIIESDETFHFWGICGYVISWGMLGLGLILAGPQGLKYSRILLKRFWQFLARVFNWSHYTQDASE